LSNANVDGDAKSDEEVKKKQGKVLVRRKSNTYYFQTPTPAQV
jgi:hypothetical protein